jgi:phosphate/sulfate permease
LPKRWLLRELIDRVVVHVGTYAHSTPRLGGRPGPVKADAGSFDRGHGGAGVAKAGIGAVVWGGLGTTMAATVLSPLLGFALATTHTIACGIIGVGAARRSSPVRWDVAGSIVVAWVLTLPAAALIGALAYWAAAFI